MELLRFLGRSALALVALVLLAAPAAAQDGGLSDEVIQEFEWRSIGPAIMSGRVTDIEGLASPSRTFSVAAAAGGIWKTTNGGITFRPLFQNERTAAMGDIAIAPSDSMIVWAGTGEEDSRNSISPGYGVYKSTDGGLTWEHMGLEGTEHIGRVVVHPFDPDVVYVAALGPLWREGGERGLYRTTDGGQNWELVKFVSDRAGFVDVAMHPRNPDVLFASSWERIRGPYYLQSGGPGSGLWKSTDGGDSWTEVTGGGLPETMLGRIGIDINQSNPDVMYLMVEAEAPSEDEERLSGLYRSEDGGETWVRTNDFNTRPFYYSEVRSDPNDPDRVYFSSLRWSPDGGLSSGSAAGEVHVDFHAMWIDPNDSNRVIFGNDGGIAISFDRGGNFWVPNTFPIGQFYNIEVGPGTPYRVCGGMQDNYTWCGPSRKTDGPITNHDWFRVSGGDGFVVAIDPRNPDIVYSESQRGRMGRSNLATGERVGLGRPSWQEGYRARQDSIAMLWPDSTQPMPAQHRNRIETLQLRATADSAALDLRYNWNTPFFLSPHDPDVFYAGANRVLKSTDMGETLVPISPDLTRQNEEKIRISTETTGGITPDITGAETFATIVSLAESPVQPGLLYAGTDDGNVWMTPDDGASWIDITDRFAGLVPDGTYVSRIEPSQYTADRVYITFDNHRRGDFMPYVMVSDDGAESFRSISSDLPTGGPDFTHVIREDPVNPALLYVGTDVGVYVSVNRGMNWQPFMTGFPTVPVHDLKIHPRERELVAGTHGRSIWIVDVAPLQQMTPAVLASDVHLFQPAKAMQFGMTPTGGEFTAQAYFEAPSPEYGAKITYWLGEDLEEEARIEIRNSRGVLLETIEGSASAGLHSEVWDYDVQSVQLPRSPSERRDSIAVAQRLHPVVDSLADAGHDRDRLERLADQLRSGQGGGGGFGGGGGSDEWEERPAEGRLSESNVGQEEEAEEGPEQVSRNELFRIVRGIEGGGGFRFFGGGSLFPQRSVSPGDAGPGEYTVTLIAGDQTRTTVLTVAEGANAPEN